MNGQEKSDSAIVAGKPTNGAGQPAEESVEPRAEAKGNAGQQSTGRAQDRGSVSQALERIRQAARQRKEEQFTALFHHLTIDLLEDAFGELKPDASAGVDGLTWKEYDVGRERNLADLHARRSTEEQTGRCPAGECTFRSRMADSDRSRSPLSKTRSSKERQSQC